MIDDHALALLVLHNTAPVAIGIQDLGAYAAYEQSIKSYELQRSRSGLVSEPYDASEDTFEEFKEKLLQCTGIQSEHLTEGDWKAIYALRQSLSHPIRGWCRRHAVIEALKYGYCGLCGSAYGPCQCGNEE